jgi:N-methylhydantoinase B
MDLVLANVRAPHERHGDLQAQLAAHRIADERLRELVDRHGVNLLRLAIDSVLDYSERRARQAISQLPDGVYRGRSEIEGDGTEDIDIRIEVTVTVDGDRIVVDFDGTSGSVPGNVNCPISVTRSACYFAVTVLLPRDIAPNAGSYTPIEVRAPEGCLVHAQHPSAVVAGNMETSQRIADTVMIALAQATDMPAQGQGTMNALVIGGVDWTYIETLGGGQGASRKGPGSSGVHVGMSNTLNTPVEALEAEFPLRVSRYELRYGSGGDGRHRGGDGLIRSIEVLAPAKLSLLSDRRRHRPQGVNGGGAGATGCNRLNDLELPPKASGTMGPGDVITVETPGGGGWGAVEARSAADATVP